MLYKKPTLSISLSLLVGTAFALMASATTAGTLGELKINGTADVAGEADDASVRLADTTYAWHAGDRITTGDSTAVLTLDDGGHLGIGRNSEVRIDRSDGTVEAELLDGTVLYAFPDADARFRIRAGDLSLATTGAEPGLRQVSDAPAGIAGAVEYTDGERVRVSVRDGRLSIDHGGGSTYQVDAGERISFLSQGPVTVDTQVGGSAGASIQAPERVPAESEFQVEWQGPGESGDYISIAPEGAPDDAFESFARTGQGEQLEFIAPTEPGNYEVRYMDGDSQRVLATRTLIVEENRAVAAAGGGNGGNWFARNPVLSGLIIAGGAYAIYEATDDDDDDEPVSP